MVFFSSEIEDGNSHSHFQLPVLLCGGGAGTITPGVHTDYGSQPLANLFIAMLRNFGVDVNSFGDDGSGALSI